MNKSESKYFNTAERMDKAFLELLSKKEFEYITVKEICTAAEVNRSTFYLHYENIGELLDETMEYIGEKFNSYFDDASLDVSKIDTLPKEELYLITPEYLIPWLTFILDNKRLFQTFLLRHDTLKIADAYNDIFSKVISPILARYNVKKEDREYIFLFYVEGIVGIVKQWIREGCSRSAREIAEIISGCIKKYEK